MVGRVAACRLRRSRTRTSRRSAAAAVAGSILGVETTMFCQPRVRNEITCVSTSSGAASLTTSSVPDMGVSEVSGVESRAVRHERSEERRVGKDYRHCVEQKEWRKEMVKMKNQYNLTD